jgi:hypothetical protein
MVQPPVPVAYQYFGIVVALDGEDLAIGSPMDDPFGRSDSGSVFLARHGRSGWVLDQEFGASDAYWSDHLGTAVTFTSEALLASAPDKDTTYGYDWGGLYLYPRPLVNLDATPSAPPPATDVTVSAYYGDPGDNCLITIEDVGGAPTFLPVLLYVFGSDHTMTFTATTPPVHYGISVGMRSYRVSPFGGVARSDLTWLDL